MGLRIQLFGEFAIWRDEIRIEQWHGEKDKALLKLLISEPGRPFLHDELVEHLCRSRGLIRV